MQSTLSKGGRVVISGCGATGRLAITMEVFWRAHCSNNELTNSIIGFTAGGDAALIRAAEGFEDSTDKGREQLLEFGFKMATC